MFLCLKSPKKCCKRQITVLSLSIPVRDTLSDTDRVSSLRWRDSGTHRIIPSVTRNKVVKKIQAVKKQSNIKMDGNPQFFPITSVLTLLNVYARYHLVIFKEEFGINYHIMQ